MIQKKPIPRAQSYSSAILRFSSWISAAAGGLSIVAGFASQSPAVLMSAVGGIVGFATLRAIAITSDAALIAARATIVRDEAEDAAARLTGGAS